MDAQFRHVGPFLERDPKIPIPQTPAGIEIELQQAAETALQASKPAALVRLRVTSDVPEAPYFYVVTYLVILTYEGSLPAEVPSTGKAERPKTSAKAKRRGGDTRKPKRIKKGP